MATIGMPGTASCTWHSSCSQGGRVKRIVLRISDPKAWCLLLYPTNNLKRIHVCVCVCVGVCVGMGGWMCEQAGRAGGVGPLYNNEYKH